MLFNSLKIGAKEAEYGRFYFFKCALTLLLITLFAGCGAGSTRAKVLEVIDGDTVRLSSGKLLRYIGVDTPEIRKRGRGSFVYNPEPFSLKAKEYNRSLVEGREVRIEYDVQKQDKYGRVLGYCFVKDANGEEIFVNEKLISSGYGVLFTYPPNVKYVNDFTSAQESARRQARGIWAVNSIVNADDAHKHIGEFAIVRGKVLSCYDSGGAIFLNFGSDYRKDFTIVIFKKNEKYFIEAGIPPCQYRGRTVEVVGKIKEYNGPEIIVRHPSQLAVIE